MSYTEIYKIDSKGDVTLYSEIRNAHRGAMVIWRSLEEKYLPPYDYSLSPYMSSRLSPITRVESSMFGGDGLKEIWGLQHNKDVSINDLLVLHSTFDDVILFKHNIPFIIEAFNNFEFDTSLKEQALVLDELYNDIDCIGVCWNQTSVNCDAWRGMETEDGNELRPFNIYIDMSDEFYCKYDIYDMVMNRPRY